MIPSHAVPVARADLRVEGVEDATVVVDPSTGQVHHLNASASLIWATCDGSATVGDVVQAVVDAYDIAADVAQSDVLAVLGQLRDKRLLEIPTDPQAES